MEKPTVLYIAGYGRSGSTILDILLGSHHRIVSAGELVYLGEEWEHPGRTCACGMDYRNCPFWKDVFSSTEEAIEWKRLLRRVESRGRLLRLVSGLIPDRDRRTYRNRMHVLFSHIAERGNARIVVDSSKSARHAAGRFWALRNIAEFDVRVLHLVRDGRSVLRSVVEKGTNWAVEGYRKEKSFRAERTVVGWNLANGLTWILGASLSGDRYLRVRYEDLLRSPESIFDRIGSFIGEDLSSINERIAANETFPVGHNVSGNRIRRNESIRLRRKTKSREFSWSELSIYHQIIFHLIGKWMNNFFGY